MLWLLYLEVQFGPTGETGEHRILLFNFDYFSCLFLCLFSMSLSVGSVAQLFVIFGLVSCVVVYCFAR